MGTLVQGFTAYVFSGKEGVTVERLHLWQQEHVSLLLVDQGAEKSGQHQKQLESSKSAHSHSLLLGTPRVPSVHNLPQPTLMAEDQVLRTMSLWGMSHS